MIDNEIYRYKATVSKVYDGDTIWLVLSLGFNQYMGTPERPVKVRFLGVNTPEIRTRDKEEKKRGYLAKSFVEDMIPPGTQVMVRTQFKSRGNFGRILGEVFVERDGKLVSITEALIEAGHEK